MPETCPGLLNNKVTLTNAVLLLTPCEYLLVPEETSRYSRMLV